MVSPKRRFGFTLSELLVALGILGVISAFAIPKLIQGTSRSETVAKLKDAMNILETAWYNAKTQGNYAVGSPLYNTIASQVNALTVSADSPPAGTGCFTSIGFVTFAGGLTIAGLDARTVLLEDLGADVSPGDTLTRNNLLNNEICIDVNGRTGPNTPGGDVFYGDFSQNGNFDGELGQFTPGADTKNFWWGAANAQLYNQYGAYAASILSANALGRFIGAN